MNDERFLKDWLQDTTDPSSDPQAAADKVMADVPKTKQRSRWWPLLPGRRRTADDGSPSGSTRRTTFMLSPVKAITAGVLVFAFGGALLIAQPVGHEGDVAPAATTGLEGAAPVEVSGRIAGRRGGCDETSYADLGDIQHMDSELCFNSWQMTDDRLTGDVRRTISQDTFGAGSGLVLNVTTHTITNGSGTWRERPILRAGFPSATIPADTTMRVFDGEGAYEGLIAVAEFRPTDDGTGENDIYGFIVEGEHPIVREGE